MSEQDCERPRRRLRRVLLNGVQRLARGAITGPRTILVHPFSILFDGPPPEC